MYLFSSETILTIFSNYLIFSYIYGITRNIYYRINSSYCKYNDSICIPYTRELYILLIISIVIDTILMPLVTPYRIVEDYNIYDARGKKMLAYLPNSPPLILFDRIYMKKEYKFGRSVYKI
jgi:hypothetical protein